MAVTDAESFHRIGLLPRLWLPVLLIPTAIAIAAAIRLPPRASYRLCDAAGLAKLAVAGQEPKEDLHRPA